MNNEKLTEVSVKQDDYSVIIKIPVNDFYNNTEVIINALKQCLSSITGENAKISLQSVGFEQFKEKPKAPVRDDFKIRDRLPNNIVDVKELDIKQAVIEEALVRCPHCGQAHCLAVNAGSKIYLMERNFNNNEFNIIAEFDSLTSNDFVNVCCKPDTNRLDYFNDLQNALVINYEDFAANNDTEVFCPVCCQSDSFMNWKNAFENPLDYFETEHLCDVCGGETVTKMVKKTKITKCEHCGHETKYKEE